MFIIRILLFFVTLFFVSSVVKAQQPKLTDYILYPRLDSTYWLVDNDMLNSAYHPQANKCETCVFQQTDSTRGRFCFNTSTGHIQMDTTLHDFAPEKLIGKWEVVNFGLFEVKDSILADAKVYFREEKIVNNPKDAQGHIIFTDKRIKNVFKNMDNLPSINKRYKILNKRFLTVRRINGFCGATIIGMVKDDFLIVDDHLYKTHAVKGKYMTVKTSIRRIILKRT